MSRWMIVLIACALTACAVTGPAGAQGEPLTLEEGLARIRDLGDEARWDEALPVAEGLVAAYPESADAVLWRGIARSGTGDPDAARADYERAVALDPTNLRAQHLWAATVSIFELEAHDAALRAFVDLCADAIEADPNNVEAYVLRGQALRALWQTSAAEADLRRALELDPENVEALMGLAGVLRADRRVEAIAVLERVLELRPQYVVAHERLADRYDREGRWREAITHCELSAEINPRRAWPHGLMAFIYWTGPGDIAAALAAAERAIEIEPDESFGWTIKARVLLEGRGDPEAALAVVDEALTLTEDDQGALRLTKSLALQAVDRNEEALDALSAAIDQAPTGYTYNMRLERAKLLLKMERYAEAWQDVHAMDREIERLGGVSAHEDLREQLEQAMPEPQPEDNDAPAAPPEEGN